MVIYQLCPLSRCFHILKKSMETWKGSSWNWWCKVCYFMACILSHILFDTDIFSYRQTSNISRTFVGNKLVDHSDVVGASPAGAAPTDVTYSLLTSVDWAETTARRDEKHLFFFWFCMAYTRGLMVIIFFADDLHCHWSKFQYREIYFPTCLAWQGCWIHQ